MKIKCFESIRTVFLSVSSSEGMHQGSKHCHWQTKICYQGVTDKLYYEDLFALFLSASMKHKIEKCNCITKLYWLT